MLVVAIKLFILYIVVSDGQMNYCVTDIVLRECSMGKRKTKKYHEENV
ncbi:MAG: hypothetical protein AAF714_00065 [Pseudomonadota bacterium]